MKCPFCGHDKDKVVDSRESREGQVIRRRRECLSEACGRRFTTYEQVEVQPVMVVKKDGRRERFDRKKLLEGMLTVTTVPDDRRHDVQRVRRIVPGISQDKSIVQHLTTNIPPRHWLLAHQLVSASPIL